MSLKDRRIGNGTEHGKTIATRLDTVANNIRREGRPIHHEVATEIERVLDKIKAAHTRAQEVVEREAKRR